MMRRAAAIAIFSLVSSCAGANEERSGQALSAEAARGKAAFSPCAICHAVAPPDTPEGKAYRTGPTLFGVYGRPAASRPGFDYTKALRESGLVWDEATLDAFLADPQTLARGSRMVFVEPDAAMRRAIIDYLKTLQ